MKKKIFILLILTLPVIISSCNQLDSEGVSRITNYAVITQNGDQEMFVLTGTPFSDPGGTATEEGAEIELKASYSGTYFASKVDAIDTSIPDKYLITYSAVNKDGFAGKSIRTVWVAGQGDLVNSIEGLYTSTVVRNGVSAADYTDMSYVIIAKTGDNTYTFSDAIGGYYDLGRGYGPGYAASGATITANNIAANSFSFGDSFGVGAFGGDAKITSLTVNPGNKTINFVTSWDADPETNYEFKVTLTQVAIQ